MSNLNKNLRNAKRNPNDEFYTQLVDIEKELKHYKDHFKGKVVYCNADDPRVSNFFHYFSYNFEYLGLKKLITTCYKNQEMDLFSMHDRESAIALVYEGEKDNGRVPKAENIGIIELEGDGDFRSPEAIEFLKEADIVVTNPPFSLFREFIGQLMEYKKDFLVIGNINALTYREIFSLVKDDKLWLGHNTTRRFLKPDGSLYETARTFWYTNLDTPKRHEEFILYKKYTPEEYHMYENYDAINVDKAFDIPMDYEGLMGVPVTFLDKYNPEQFEIIGLGISNSGKEIGVKPYKPEHRKYRKEVQKRGAVDGDLYMIIDGKLKVPYARVLIRNKKVKKNV